jgi:hypothetical protein
MRGKRELTTGERRQTGCGCAMLLALAGFAALGTIETPMCETTTFARSISPSGFTEARVQMTDCGAVSGFSRVVWIQPRWLPSDRWLSCRAVAFDGTEPITLRWTADSLNVASAVPKTSMLRVESGLTPSALMLRRMSASLPYPAITEMRSSFGKAAPKSNES